MNEELRHELVRLTYSPEIVNFELTREQGLEILEEIERLNKENKELKEKLSKIKKLVNRTPRQTPKEIAYIMLKSEISEVIGVDKE